jgi:uncharacterized protein
VFHPRRFAGCPLALLELPVGASLSLYVAEGMRARLVGLAALPRVPGGLLMPRCRSVHTVGMRFPIDVVFLSWPPDPCGRVEVLAVRERLAPLRIASLAGAESARRRSSTAVAELAAGTAVACGLAAGAVLRLSRESAAAGRSRPPG